MKFVDFGVEELGVLPLLHFINNELRIVNYELFASHISHQRC